MNYVIGHSVPEPIKEFRGSYAFLSNFHKSVVMLGGLSFPTVEHAFQAAKTEDVEQRISIMLADTPAQAKRLGRQVTLRGDWEDMKITVMHMLLTQKFEQASLKERLLATLPRLLEEGNSWSDTFWGVDLTTGKGKNVLGKLLMQVRLEIHLRDVPPPTKWVP
jgi:ribA/ribD-fused uncharacterized protein